MQGAGAKLAARLPLLASAAAALMLFNPGAHASGTGAVGVAAVVPSKNNCKFNGSALTLDFGSIDPASASNATASATLTFVCNGAASLATFFISANDGLYASSVGARRMRHATATLEFLPYSLTLSPTSATVAKGVNQTLTVTGTIQPFQFQNAQGGAYQDTVTLTISP